MFNLINGNNLPCQCLDYIDALVNFFKNMIIHECAPVVTLVNNIL